MFVGCLPTLDFSTLAALLGQTSILATAVVPGLLPYLFVENTVNYQVEVRSVLSGILALSHRVVIVVLVVSSWRTRCRCGCCATLWADCWPGCGTRETAHQVSPCAIVLSRIKLILLLSAVNRSVVFLVLQAGATGFLFAYFFSAQLRESSFTAGVSVSSHRVCLVRVPSSPRLVVWLAAQLENTVLPAVGVAAFSHGFVAAHLFCNLPETDLEVGPNDEVSAPPLALIPFVLAFLLCCGLACAPALSASCADPRPFRVAVQGHLRCGAVAGVHGACCGAAGQLPPALLLLRPLRTMELAGNQLRTECARGWLMFRSRPLVMTLSRFFSRPTCCR